MKWFGFPVEVIEATVDGRMVRVGLVYAWANGARREIWDIPKAFCDLETVQRRPMPEGAPRSSGSKRSAGRGAGSDARSGPCPVNLEQRVLETGSQTQNPRRQGEG